MKRVVFILALIVLAGCAPIASESDIKELQKVELREYQGQRLDSIDDFRENSIRGPPSIDINKYSLEISGLVKSPKIYTYNQVLQYPSYSKVVTLYCVEGWDATILWEGVLVRDLVNEAIPLPEARTIIFYAFDGYSTSFPLEYIMDSDIIMAYKMNNETLIPARGFPFQLVAEDKWGYKWIKWITKIELSDKDYEGFWESRGYSNTGNLDEPYFER